MRTRTGLAMLALAAAGGCARQPPAAGNTGGTVLSGKRLVVNMVFRAPVNPNFHYFLLLNNAGNQNASGPIPVLAPPYGNGFASASGGNSGFTDFVRFDNLQPQGYGLYHVVGNANDSNFIYEGTPVTYLPPLAGNGTTLSFQLDLAQIVTDAGGGPLADPNQTMNVARSLRYLQVNLIATNSIPRDRTTPTDKEVDSLGDTRTLTGQTSFLIVDLSQYRVYRNSDLIGQSTAEPPDNDVFGTATPDPSLDLVDWSIEVRQQ